MSKTAEKAKPAAAKIGGNIEGLYETIKSAKEKIDANKKKIKALNDDNKAIRENLESLGVGKESFDIARRRGELDPDKRKAFDNAFVICCEAFQMPVSGAQLDLGLDKKEGADAQKGAE